MSTGSSLFSDQWYRVAGLRPRLSPELRLERHRIRGERWWVLASEDGQRSHRLDATAHALVGRCSGRHTVARVWEALNWRLGDAAPTQDEVIQILSRLHAEGWLRFDTTPDLSGLLTERRRRERQRRPFNPLAVRVPLGDPQRLLTRLDPLARRLFSAPAGWLWAALVVAAMLAGAPQFDALVAHGAKWLPTPHYLVILWCAYPLIKLVHELAHGLAVRRWGGQVRQAGVTLLMLTPVPYIDASAANLFPRATHRALVSAAGVMAELAVAAVALLLWVALAPGLPRDIAFVAVTIGCVSTLAVNANPLLRFDGYFALCDLLELPNLAARSRTWWGELLRERLLGLAVDAPLRLAPRERPWLIAYAPLSWAYQVALALLFAGWIAGHSPLAGVAAGLLLLALLLGRPALGAWRFMRELPAPAQSRRVAQTRAALVGAVLLGVVALAPLPDRTVAQGVVWLPERALVRAGEDGFIDEFLVEDGATVADGQVVARMRNPALAAARERLLARLDGLQARHYAALRDDPTAAAQSGEDISQAGLELDSVEARLAALELRAGAAGRLVMPRQSDRAGGFARRGQLLAYVVADDPAIVRVAVPQARAALLRDAAATVQVRLAATPDEVRTALLARDTVAADPRLPSAALSAEHGGPFVTDPADEEHRRTLTPVVTLDVRLTDRTSQWLGARAAVRFEHGYCPLLVRWVRDLQQAFLQRAQAGVG